ncbi:sensor histidine kinase [Nocardiopsis metallicus]|uniref:histidine kinase n=1 Tax=Nocardiopsis metallicus TaxID=179819 RepID=A0A840WG60_9ACTN|nr:histidine kinase [Nocardiopsis metallicus]MBB5494433.1 signal transduction histidine kinase [Nocardiopsis metallicus]
MSPSWLPTRLNRLFVPDVNGFPVWAYLAALAVTLVMPLLWTLDLVNVLSTREIDDWIGPPHSRMDFAYTLSGAVCALSAALAVWPRVGPWATLAAGSAAPLSVLAASALLWPAPKGVFGYPLGVAEVFGMLVLLALTALRCRPWQVALVSVLCALAVYSDYLRDPFSPDPTSALLMVAVGLAPGLYLRWRQAERRAHVDRVRAEERLAIARDLHDVVAHEVTGIVVQAQALRHVAERDPEAVRAVLPEIEAAGARALESMRGMVSRLREPGEAPLTAEPSEVLTALAAPASHGRPEVSVHVSGPVRELPAEVGTAVLRIAQESVTNALRYARGASRVSVVVCADSEEVRLRVRDDGWGGSGRGAGGTVGGGHGLVGMAERARILGGDLSAGPDGIGQGWTVRATIPAPRDQGNEQT